MFAYRTNNPQYLEYVARVLSRSQIEADPVLCQWLNNPYTKDNMELAIRYNEAEEGGLEEKKAFVEYLLCNGPELDADTILYYREKILVDTEYRQVAYTYYSNIDKIDELREVVYGKTSKMTSTNSQGKDYDWFNCFKAPCNYLGPFSARQGSDADASINAATPANIIAEAAAAAKRKGGSAFSGGPESAVPMSKDQKEVPDALGRAEGASGNTPAEVNGGAIPWWMKNYLPPKVMEEYFKYLALRSQQVKDLVEEYGSAGLLKKVQAGDPVVLPLAEATRMTLKGNYRRLFGDCSRLINQVRDYNPFNPAQAKQQPISASQIVGNTAPDGQKATPNTPASIASAVPKSKGKAAALENGQYTTYLKLCGLEVQASWSDQNYYDNIVNELMKQETNWDLVEEYIAGYFVKVGKRMNGSYKELKQKLQDYKAKGDEEDGLQNILGAYGIGKGYFNTADAVEVPLDPKLAS